MRPAYFAVLLALSLGLFGRTMYTMVRAAAMGTPDPRPRLDQLPARLWSVLVYFLGQKKVAEEGPRHLTSKHHLLIFWGFLVITVGTGELILSALIPSFNFGVLLPAPAYTGLRTLIDVFNLIVLIMITWAIIRRVFFRPKLIPMNLDAAIILGAIASLMITHFLFHGYHGAEYYAANGAYPSGAPVSNLVAGYFEGTSAKTLALGASAAFWVHSVIVLAFLNYLPFSKHIHLLGALPNIFLRNLSDRKMDMPKLDLEDENQWGVTRVEQFSWKSLVDNYACTECARCSNYCPAYDTDKNLSPMQLVHDIRYEMLDRAALFGEKASLEKSLDRLGGDDLAAAEKRIAELESTIESAAPLAGGRIAEDTLWACTTCGACQDVCPVFIEHPLKIIQMRQSLVLEQEKVPAELGRAFRNIERQSNPWGIGNSKRMEWAEGLDVPLLADNPDPEYILWVGCAGAFDNRIVKQTKAMVKLLGAAEVDYAVLGHDEGCTGDPARRAGNEMLFQMQAETNVEVLNAAGAKKVITSCPHCLHTLRHDYPQFGGNFEVIHHTQLLAHLIEQGRLDTDGNPLTSVVYHDSCYLGRWNGEYDAPRKVLEHVSVPGGLVEVPNNRRHGFCCGAGGGRMFMEEEGPRVNERRTDELLEAKTDTVAVACPFCSIMLTDGMKARNAEEDVEVLDVAEILARRLVPDVPVSNLTRKVPAADS